MKLRLAEPSLLVDLRRVPDLSGIERENGGWKIGAMTRHVQLQNADELGLLQRVATLIADQQVRNRGTIGGSLAHGDSASDLPTALLAAEGTVTATGSGGGREIAAADLFEDYLTTSLAPDEIVTEVRVPALEETSFYDPENFVFPFGAHACIVDVEEETGKVKVVRYVAVDDCGPAINPMLIDGQVHGGIAQAIGQALYEHVAYDEDGQLVTGTFVDYALPTAAELPSFETDRTETPSPVNSLGVKGVGEAGTIAATPAVLNAVVDALRPKGVTYLNMPLFPEAIWRAMNEQNGGAA
jgi:CO/xanthine dehydrogenase Mo-binding subunit